MSEISDKETISSMRKKRKRPFSSDKEKVTNIIKINGKRYRIVAQYSSSEGESTNNNEEKIDESNIERVRRYRRNSKKRYITQIRKFEPEKIFENTDCRCRNACTKNYNEEERRNIFEEFWSLGNSNKQNLFLYQAVQRRFVKRKRPANGKGPLRYFTFRYFLNSKDEKVRVCKKFFLDTFKITEARLKRILNCTYIGNELLGLMV